MHKYCIGFGMTNYWFVIHDLWSYRKHPDKIGRGLRSAKRDKIFRGIRNGDRVIYYVKNKVVVGIFKVVSGMYLSKKGLWDRKAGQHYVYDIAPIYVAPTERPIRINPEDYNLQYKQRTAIKLTLEQYKNMVSDILGMDHPKFEIGVISLFAKVHRELGFPFLKVLRDKFPDCIAENKKGKEVKIEFERKSSNFEAQDHDPKKCDYIVCWINDLGALAPIKVIELKELVYGH